MSKDERRPDTRALAATQGDRGHHGLGLSIEQHATWGLKDAEQGAAFSEAVAPPAFYSRWGNPTVRRVEEAVARLEGAEAALATASGMGAISTALIHLSRTRKHIVAQRSLYAGTAELLGRVLPEFGVTTELVEGPDTDGFIERITPETAFVYLETPSNPLLEISDIEAVGQAARDHGVPVLVDNTFASPINQRPLELGASLVLHSATKYFGGHSDVTGGVMAGDASLIEGLWKTYKLLGATLAPNDAFLIHRGLKTLALRVRQQTASAGQLATFLDGHAAVERVYYPGLKGHPGHDVAARQMDGFGAMLSFEVAGGFAAAKRVLESVEVATLGVSLGSVETLIQHPASMTHAPLSPAERAAAGIPEGLIRLSVGIEDVADLREDLDRALS